MKSLGEMDTDELEQLSEQVAQALTDCLPPDAIWVLILGDQHKYRGVMSKARPETVLDILKFTTDMVRQQTIENN